MQREVEELTERVCPRPEDHLRPPLLPLSAQQGTSRSQSPVQASSQIQTRSASPARPASPIRPRAPSNAHIGPGIPHFVPNGGVFNTTALVNIFADAPGAVIFYSTNGSKPSVTHYEGQGPQPLSVYLSKTCTLKAISVVGGVAGEVVSSDFVVDLGDRHHYQHVVHVSSHRTERHRSPPDPPQPMEAPNVPAGVGMLLERSEKSHHVRVKHIMPGGAADLQGSIRLGDRLLSVDDASVDTLPFPQLLEAIKGPPGSRIRLCLIRDGVSPSPSPSSSTRTSPPRPYTVNLQRQQVQGVGVLGTYASPTLSHPTNFIPTPTSTKSISTLASMPASVMPSPYDVQQTINSPSALFGHQGGVSPVRHSSNASGARRELAGGFGAATGQGGHGYNLYM
uniref:PDZ domain-containing protein n=1 Tax=Hemiselmis tepida TaxID=464990 RepID=A0A7S0Z062_9CRYP